MALELRRIRQAKGFSQLAIAQKTGLSRAAIQHIENGIRNPTLMVAHAISAALETPLSRILLKVEKNRSSAFGKSLSAEENQSLGTKLPSPISGEAINLKGSDNSLGKSR